MWKKILCMILGLMLVLPTLGLAEGTETDAETAEEYVAPEELIVTHPTITKGDFFTEMFGNDTADIDVRALIHGYNLVNWDQNQGVYVLDPTVVTDVLVTDDELGNRTYNLVIAEDLYFSDGTPITAWDYAFSLLLMMAPEVEEIGGKIYRAQHLLGYEEYINYCRGKIEGKTDADMQTDEYAYCLGGVVVLSDHQLEITLDHDFLPYFFEVGLLLCEPYPIHVIAPGCKVKDDGYGVYLANADESVEEPVFTPELLKKTILDPETGYNSHPSVVSGPYTMTSYDGITSHFERNPYFKGAWFHNSLPGGNASGNYVPMLDENDEQMVDSQGNPMYLVIPQIEKIAFTVGDYDVRNNPDGSHYVGENSSIHKITENEVHLVNKVVNGTAIVDGMGLMGDGVRMQAYPRIGLSFLTFTYDWPTVHEKEVRQAIAWCMDREQLTEDYCGAPMTLPAGVTEEAEGTEEGEKAETEAAATPDAQVMNFGMVMDGYYGREQWEYLLVTDQLEYPVNMLDEVLPPVHEVDEEEKLLSYKNRYVRTQEEFDSAIAAWETLSLDNLTHYGVYDLENDPNRTEKTGIKKANALLDDAGWTLNAEGGTYQPGVDKVRAKKIDDKLVTLNLKMMYPEGNHIVDTIQENFIDNLNEVGITLELVPTPMQDLLYSYYRQTERTTDMIYLATNFHIMVDPSITYSTDKTLNHEIWNNTYSDDEELWYKAVDMRRTDPMDVFGYVSKWVSFQERYNEVLPTIPVYSNIYYDFYTDQLQNYFITGQVTWSQAILLAYFGDPSQLPEEPVEEEAGLADDEAVFDD
jgi:ABC-type transport system substrate-binding protein